MTLSSSIQRILRGASDVPASRDAGSAGYVEIAHVAIEIDRAREASTLELTATYTLRACGEPQFGMALVDPRQGTISRLTSSAGPSEALTGENEGMFYIRRARGATFDGATVEMQARYPVNEGSADNCSPVCVLPTHLPQPLTPQGPNVLLDAGPAPRRSQEPRLTLSAPLVVPHGAVRDSAGDLLMVAVPYTRRLQESIVHADDTLVLCGHYLRSLSDAELRFLIGLHEEVRKFFDSEVGRGDRISVLGFYDEGVSQSALRLEAGHISLSDQSERRMPELDVLPAERSIVRHIAAIWWRHGVRPAGLNSAGVALGLREYLVLRWFEVTGRPKSLAKERAFLEHVIVRLQEIDDEARRWELVGAQLALALHDASRTGPALRDELRRWCEEDWGCAVSADWISGRLTELGVSVPTGRA